MMSSETVKRISSATLLAVGWIVSVNMVANYQYQRGRADGKHELYDEIITGVKQKIAEIDARVLRRTTQNEFQRTATEARREE